MSADVATRRKVVVGDFFYASWGYDQTNIDYYKVVGLTPKGVKIQHWTSQVLREQGCGDQVVPGFEPRRGCWVRGTDGVQVYDRECPAPIETKRLKYYGDKPSLAWQSYANLYLWDCAGHFQTGSGFGH